MAQKIIQMQMRHLYCNLKDLFSNRKGFVILTSLLRFKNKSREFREVLIIVLVLGSTYILELVNNQAFGNTGKWKCQSSV